MFGAWGVDLNLQLDAPTVGAFIALAGALVGLWVNGDRAERDRRRQLHARALKAIVDYGEMPFMIRRRRCEDSEQSAERVRLSDHFSHVKAEISACQVLLWADGDQELATAYDDVVEVARATAGQEAHVAWMEPAIKADSEMNMGAAFAKLQPFREALESFKHDLARATLPRRKRLSSSQ